MTLKNSLIIPKEKQRGNKYLMIVFISDKDTDKPDISGSFLNST